MRINESCMTARQNIMTKCYRGGNQAHKDEVENVRKVYKDCADRYEKAGGA